MTPEELAKKHAEWTGEFTKKVYYEAFLHGYKHAMENKDDAKHQTIPNQVFKRVKV